MAALFDSLPVAPVLRTFVQYLIVFCGRPEAASDVISGKFVRPSVPDKFEQFREPRLNLLEKFDTKLSETAFSTVWKSV